MLKERKEKLIRCALYTWKAELSRDLTELEKEKRAGGGEKWLTEAIRSRKDIIDEIDEILEEM